MTACWIEDVPEGASLACATVIAYVWPCPEDDPNVEMIMCPSPARSFVAEHDPVYGDALHPVCGDELHALSMLDLITSGWSGGG